MQLSKIVLGLLCSLLLLVACEQPEDFPRFNKDYPILLTGDAIDIDKAGATLTANIFVPDGEVVTSFGFTIITTADKTLNIELSTWKTTDDFNYRLTSDHQADEIIRFYAYAQTSNYKLTGETHEFTSLGSSEPEILDYFPKTVTIQSEMSVIGKNLSLSNTVVFPSSFRASSRRGFAAEVIKGDIDTLRFFLNGTILDSDIRNLTVTSAGTENTLSPPLNLLLPKVISLDKNKGFVNETEFVLTVDNFNPSLALSQSISKLVALENQRDNGARLTIEILGATENNIRFTTGIYANEGVDKVVFIPHPNYEVPADDIELKYRWEKVGTFPGSTPIFTSMQTDNFVYVMSRREFQRYDMTNNTWTPLTGLFNGSDIPVKLFNLGNSIILWRRTTSGQLDQFWSYNKEQDRWTMVSDQNIRSSGRRFSTVKNGKIHVVTQLFTVINSITENFHYIFDPANNSWTSHAFDLSASDPDFKLGEAYFERNGTHYLTTPSERNGYTELYSIDLSTSTPGFSLVSSAELPRVSNSLPVVFWSAMNTDEGVIFLNSSREQPDYFYSFINDEWKNIGPRIGIRFRPVYELNGDVFGISSGSDRSIYRFRKSFD